LALLGSKSNPQVLLASGSSDGRWVRYARTSNQFFNFFIVPW
jgi:hypothetical protein